MSETTKTGTILKINASARTNGSTSRKLADEVTARLIEEHPGARVIERDLADGLPFIDEAWVGANFTVEEERTPAQKLALAVSDALVEELRAADHIVLGVPIYNFSVPAVMKAWIDQVARARVTFRYTENGPVGLLEGKKAYLVVASGGTPVGSEIDFATGYLRHVLGFLGIHDLELIAADQLMAGAEEKLEAARTQIEALFREHALV